MGVLDAAPELLGCHMRLVTFVGMLVDSCRTANFRALWDFESASGLGRHGLVSPPGRGAYAGILPSRSTNALVQTEFEKGVLSEMEVLLLCELLSDVVRLQKLNWCTRCNDSGRCRILRQVDGQHWPTRLRHPWVMLCVLCHGLG